MTDERVVARLERYRLVGMTPFRHDHYGDDLVALQVGIGEQEPQVGSADRATKDEQRPPGADVFHEPLA